MWIHTQQDWPDFWWDNNRLSPLLADVRFRQGRLLGRMESLGFELKSEASLTILTDDVVNSSAIEGEILNPEEVRSSIARRLGLDVRNTVKAGRQVEGIVEIMLDDGFKGFMNTSKYAKLAKCSTDTALRDLQELKQRGILIQNPGKGRSTSYRLVENSR